MINLPSRQTRDRCPSRVRANVDNSGTSPEHLFLHEFIDDHDGRLYICSQRLRDHLWLDFANLNTDRMCGVVDKNIDMTTELLFKRMNNFLCTFWVGYVGYDSSDFGR